ncbi:MAG: hypothetical protein AAF494_04625 [Pseudomonadota bacterium]
MKNIQRTLVLGCSIVALAGCGADEIVSPGATGNIDVTINNPPAPTPTPTPTQTLVTPASSCPQIRSTGGLLDTGTISGPTGEYRVCQLPDEFDADDNLPQIDGLVYRIFGQVSVGTDLGFSPTAGEANIELSIEPGVILIAAERSFFVVQRGHTIAADGTASNPIIWTSTDNLRGLTTDESQGQWGGVVLLGRAPVSDCRTGGANTPTNPNPTCDQELEGTDLVTLFGGDNSGDSSGSLTFNQIRFSGFELATDNELQSLTTGGIGSGTTINNILSFNSSDDGIEFFGGEFDANNVAVIGASDDSIDSDTGAIVNLDTVVVAQRASTGDHMIELDSEDDADNPATAIPRSVLQVNNFTFLQGAGRDTAVRVRGDAALGLTNGVLSIQRTSDTCFFIETNSTIDQIIGFNSIVGNCGTDPFRVNTGASEAGIQAEIDADANNDIDFTLSLTSGFVNGANEAAVTPFDPTARSSFFSARAFIGAEDDNIADNFGDWTCNSATLDFGSASGACTSLPGA